MKKLFFALLTCTLLWGFSTNALAQNEESVEFKASDYFENLNFDETSDDSGTLYMCPGWTIVTSMYQLTGSGTGPERETWSDSQAQGNYNWLGGSPAGDGSPFAFISGTPIADTSEKDLEYGTGGWKLVRQTSKTRMPAGYYTITCTYGCTSASSWNVETSKPEGWTPSFALFVEDEEYKVYKDAYFEWTGNPNTTWVEAGTWDEKHDSYNYEYAKTTSISIDMQHSGYLEIGFVTCGTDLTTVAIDDIVIEAELYSDDNAGELSGNIIDTYFDNADLDSGSELNVPEAWTLYTDSNNNNGVREWQWSEPSNYSMNDPLISGHFLYMVPDNSSTEVEVGTKMVAQTSTKELPAGTYHLEVAMSSNVDAEKESSFELFGLYAQIVNSSEASSTTNGTVDMDKTVYSESESSAEWEAEIVALDFSLTDDSYVEIGVMTTEAFVPSEHSPRLFFDNFTLNGAEEVIAITDAQYATYYCEHEYLLPSTVWAATTVKDTYQTDQEAGSTMGHLELDWEFAPGDLIPGGTALLVYGPEGTHYGAITKAYYPVTYGDDDVTYGHYGKGNEEGTEIKINELIKKNILFGSMSETETYVPTTSGLYEEGAEYYYYQFSYGPKNSQYANDLGFYWLIDGYADGKQTASGGPFTSEAHRCWMALPQDEVDYDGTEPAAVRGFTFDGPDDANNDGDNETTGITSVESATPASEGIYTIQGIRVSNMNQPGLYIVDGKKVLVK